MIVVIWCVLVAVLNVAIGVYANNMTSLLNYLAAVIILVAAVLVYKKEHGKRK